MLDENVLRRLSQYYVTHFWDISDPLPPLSSVLFLSISLVLLIPKKYSMVSRHFRRAQTLKLWVVVWCTFYHRWAKKWEKRVQWNNGFVWLLRRLKLKLFWKKFFTLQVPSQRPSIRKKKTFKKPLNLFSLGKQNNFP